MEKTYAILYWGSPAKVVRTSSDKDRAIRVAKSAVGTRSCTKAQVIECDSAWLAKTADMGKRRDGERCIFTA